jgi:hypothetical protein
MSTRIIVLLVVVGAMTVLGTSPADAFGYKATRLDPDDRPVDESSCCQQDPDIRSSTRKVWVDASARAWLSVTFRTYEALLGYWTVYVKLDTRGGPYAEWRMRIRDTGTGLAGCSIRKPRVSRRGYYAPLVSESGATCRVPLWLIQPNKRIRWKLFSPRGVEGTGRRVDEFAPDAGWYA